MKPMQAWPLLAVLILLLAGCAPPSVKPTAPAVADPAIARATELAAAGDHLGAAALYAGVAERAPAEARGRFLVLAAENYLSGGDRDAARGMLAAAAGTPLDGVTDLRRRLIEAELLLDEARASDAVALLLQPPPADAPLELRQRYHLDTARAFRLMGNLLESARELQALDPLLTDPQARFDNQLDIVRNLAVLSEQALQGLQPGAPEIEGGWMALALLLKQASQSPDTLTEGLVAWRQRYPTHPALPGLLDGYFERQQALVQRAARVAVLLPERGPYAKVGAAIRDGLMAAWYRDEQRPELRFYDSSDNASLWPTYNQAVADGAQVVVGPLDKDAVLQLLRAGELPVPVLGLNQVEADVAPPPNLFQFALAPEDEARQAAERAWLEGLRRPVVLAPSGEWGQRVATAFTGRWTSLGGQIAAQGNYDEQAADHSDTIQQLLLLDASTARHRELQRLLGKRLEFEPRRRADVDLVFVAAKPQQLRLLRPQLQFHHAQDLPVYTTSHAWNGAVSAREAEDVAGVLLPDMPWLLTEDPEDPLSRSRLQELLPAAGGVYGRLYAMGLDAYRLLPHLGRLQSSPLESLDGHTGHLYLNGSNQVQRQLVWAELGDPPRILGYGPRLDLEQAATPADDGTALTAPPG
ncbi:MAG: hypothetical protein RLZ44_25 [Pseudomonadota bacterium]